MGQEGEGSQKLADHTPSVRYLFPVGSKTTTDNVADFRKPVGNPS